LTNIVSIICFICVIGLVILVHEFGHFLLAKRNGVGVTEFSVGFGPKLFSKIKNGTRYVIRILPFGGYCQMLGDEVLFGEEEDPDHQIVSDEAHAYRGKNVWQRISIIFAGPFFNFILAFLFSLLLVSMIGARTTKVGAVSQDYPAAAAGLQAGDSITKIDGHSMHLFDDITMYMTLHSGEEMVITYERNGEEFETTLIPQYSEEYGRYLIGITASNREEHLSIGKVLKYGWYTFSYNTSVVFKSLKLLVTGKGSFDDLSGPIGMAGMVNDIVVAVEEDTQGESIWTTLYWLIVNLLNFSLLLSANLGIMNLLPIPAMDGGRLLFLFLEAIRGKPIDKKKEGIETIIGVILLVLLMAAVLFNDVKKVFF